MQTFPLDEVQGLPAGGERFRALGHRLVDLVADYLAGLPERPVFRPMAAEARRAIADQPLPERAVAPEALLAFLSAEVMGYPMGNGHPRFFGWVNSPPDPLAVLTELVAAAINPSCAGGDHAAIYLERCAVRWLMELVGFPVEGSMGILVSGGSMASLTALATARHRAAERDGWDVRALGLAGNRPPLVLYVAEEGHSCLRKAAELLGLGSNHVRTVPVDAHCRLDPLALAQLIDHDRRQGLRPFCVVASAGTVNTGAIDPLDAIADLCAAEDLWLHIDGAYGAVGVLDPTVQHLYRGIERADSLALDPHKWLSVPIECGCALVRDGALLRATFSLVPPYLRTEEGRGFGGLPWYSEYGFQQTRGFRTLKLWTTIAGAGREGLARRIARHNALARHLATQITACGDLELLAPVTLSIVCFRYRPPDGSAADLDALNRGIVEAVQAEGEVFLTGTTLDGRFALRACILHTATGEDDLAALVAAVRRTGAALAPTLPG
jgi:glutamate/tyrosine decarboxylase-like PLP-dependent enzyme